MTNSDIEVGKRIRSLRKIRGISLQQMAAETGMSYSYLSGLENGKHSVSITNLQRLASFFGVDMVYFLQPGGPVPRVMRKNDLFNPDCFFRDIYYRVMTPPDSMVMVKVGFIWIAPLLGFYVVGREPLLKTVPVGHVGFNAQ